jgi:AcrR family transcriptional regulator
VTYYFANKEAMITAVAQNLFDEFDALLDDQDRVDIRAIFERWLAWSSDGDRVSRVALFQ